MLKMLVDNIYNYPIKSTKPISHNQIEVKFHGLLHDRNWAITDYDYNVVTARDYPKLLEVSANVIGEKLKICHKDKFIHIDSNALTTTKVNAKVFKESAVGYEIGNEAAAFFSTLLNSKVKLIHMGIEAARPVEAKYGGKPGDTLSYADECPLLLISNASVEDLNTRLPRQMGMERFRPNITISGGEAYQEDKWKKIRIGICEFEVAQACKRCVFTTIDPNTLEKSSDQEPLRTLASYKKHPNGGVAFGVHLIPTKIGQIQKGDELIILA